MKKYILSSISALLLAFSPLLANAATTGKVTVIKQVVNIHGQTKTSADFSITGIAAGGFLLPYIDTYSVTFTGSATGTLTKIGAGTYSFTEVTDPAYNVSYSPDCTGTIVPGDNKTCTIINSDIGSDVKVIVNVNNTNGGVKVPSDFTVNFSAESGIYSPVSDPSSISFLGNDLGTMVGLNPGTYAVTLSAMSGYNFTYSADCSGSIAAVTSKVCTVTAQDIAGSSGGGGGSGGSGGGGGGGNSPGPGGVTSGVFTFSGSGTGGSAGGNDGSVLGASTNTPNTPAPGTGDPKVLGAATQLPRTGLPIALVLIPSLLGASIALKKRKV